MFSDMVLRVDSFLLFINHHGYLVKLTDLLWHWGLIHYMRSCQRVSFRELETVTPGISSGITMLKPQVSNFIHQEQASIMTCIHGQDLSTTYSCTLGSNSALYFPHSHLVQSISGLKLLEELHLTISGRLLSHLC